MCERLFVFCIASLGACACVCVFVAVNAVCGVLASSVIRYCDGTVNTLGYGGFVQWMGGRQTAPLALRSY